MPFYTTYDFVGLKNSKKRFANYNLPDVFYFVREIKGDETICDEYRGSHLVNKEITIPHFNETDYEIKTIPATFKIREYNPTTKQMTDNPKVFYSKEEARTAGLLAPRYDIWVVDILGTTNFNSFGIDPEAPWPPNTI